MITTERRMFARTFAEQRGERSAIVPLPVPTRPDPTPIYLLPRFARWRFIGACFVAKHQSVERTRDAMPEQNR